MHSTHAHSDIRHVVCILGTFKAMQPALVLSASLLTLSDFPGMEDAVCNEGHVL